MARLTARVHRVAMSTLETSSAVQPASRPHDVLPTTPAGKPRRRGRLQQTPRTPAEIAARFERLVRDTAARSSSARRQRETRSSAPTPDDTEGGTARKRPRVSDEQNEQEAVATKPPPTSTPSGNTSEDEELLRIQKRLVFGRKAPTRGQKGSDSSDSSRDARVPLRPTSPSPRARSDRLKTGLRAAGVSVLEVAAAPPKAPKQQLALSLEEWTLQWPLTFARRTSADEDKDNELQLVLEGCAQGRDVSLVVAQRVSQTQFVAATGERVTLRGCLDVAKADARGLPDAAIELLLDGLPADWQRQLEALAVRARRTRKATPRKAATRQAGTGKRGRRKAPVSDESSSLSSSEPEDEDAVMTPRRSSRVITPVMDWWRGERLTTDVHGVTVVDHGSPAFLPTRKKKRRSHTTTPGKPPRPPKAATTPVKKPTKPTPLKHRRPQKQQPAASSLSLDADAWTDEQVQALAAAKMQIPTTAANFWAEVATFVTGKSADECRTKSFEAFASPTSRGAKKKAAPAAPASATKIPTKLHRAGSNLFKKQVRTFVHEYEKKHVDDVFADTTPTKAELHGALGLDDLQSPSAPLDSSVTLDDDDDDNDDVLGARGGRLEITTKERDEVDSYVLGIKRRRLLGEPTSGVKAASRARTSFLTPSSLQKKKKPLKRAVHMYEAIGSHRVEGVVSPGGTTRVRVNKDSDATSDDDDEEERDSDDENDSDEAF